MKLAGIIVVVVLVFLVLMSFYGPSFDIYNKWVPEIDVDKEGTFIINQCLIRNDFFLSRAHKVPELIACQGEQSFSLQWYVMEDGKPVFVNGKMYLGPYNQVACFTQITLQNVSTSTPLLIKEETCDGMVFEEIKLT